MAQEGIATLPQAPENQASYGETMPFSQDLDNIKAALAKDNPEAVPVYEQGMEEATQQLNLPLEELQLVLQTLEYILKNEKNYPSLRAQLIQEGQLDEDDLPEQFDRGYFTTMLVMTQEAINRKQNANMAMTSMPAPQGFAQGGLASAAESLRQKGRYGDTVLAHINPQEAMMLKAMGGSGTINPATGLPEFFFKAVGKAISNGFKAVGNAVKSVVSSPIGKIVATVALTAALGPGGLAIGGTLGVGAGMAATALAYAVPAALASGAVSLAGGSNLSTAFREAAIAGAAGGVFGGLSGSSGLLNKVVPSLGTGFLNTAVGAFGAGTASGLLSGQKIGDALKTGAVAGVTAGGISALGGQSAFGTETPVGGAPITDRSTPFDPNEVSARQITQAGGSIASPNAVTGADPTGGASPFGIKFSGGPSSEFAMQPPGGSSGIGGLNPSVAGGPAVSTPGTYQPASFMERAGTFMKSPSLSNFGDMMIAPEPTAQQLMNSDVFRQATAQGASFNSAMSAAKDALSPGMIAKYGPAVGLGIGALSLTGGFDSKPATPPGLVERDAQGNPITGENLINQDPSRYVVQNLQGVRYDPSGRIDYSQGTNTPAYGMMGPNTVPTPAFSFNPPNYMTPSNAASQTPGQGIPQPYNTAANYDFMNSSPYYRPQRFYNMGGDVMGYQQGGSFPRRTGQIDGPGTGTSDSIPAMLSDGEFVLTARAVKGIGNGSRRDGAKKLYRMMHAMEKKAGGKV